MFLTCSKRSPNHLLTLAIDLGSECIGGTLVFPSATNNSAQWDSNGGAGSWACWFATQLHAVTKLRSGYRVIAVYNIEVASLEKDMAVSHPIRAVSESSSPLLRLPADILRLVMARITSEDELMVSLRTVTRLSSTCKALCAMLHNPAWVIGNWLHLHSSTLKQVLESIHAHR
jgi:hypothetical protein